MTVVPFTILRLPQRALQIYISLMSIVEHLALSHVSKNTKHLISMWKCDNNFVYIIVSASIELRLRLGTSLLQFSFKPDESIVEVCNLYGNRVTSQLHVPELTEKQWIEHFVSVFIEDSIVVLKIENPTERSFEDIYECVKDLNIVRLEMRSLEFRDNELIKLFPFLEYLTVSNNSISASILVQNFFALDTKNVTLDNMLTVNCSFFQTKDISDKDLNIFMRQWFKGSNPELRCLYVTFSSFFRNRIESVLFKNIDYIETGNEEDLTCFKIMRHDGATANVTINRKSVLFLA